MHRSNDGVPDQSITGRSPEAAGGPAGGADFLQLDAADAPPGGMADWLARRLREAIGDGRLPVGSRLPATRVLAADLRVSRGVVTDAYQRLIDDGHVAGRGRAGTIVVAAPLTAPPPPPPRTPARAAAPAGDGPSRPVFPERPGAEVFDALRAAPARIDLAPGVPDLAAFPRAAWLRAERRVLSGLAAPSFGYGDPRGTPALRTAVAGWLARNRGIRADPAGIVIVAGTAQALGLLSAVLRAADPGIDAVAVEDPGSLGTRQHLNHHGMRTPPVPVDGLGVRVDALRRTGAPAVLLTPAHQFPAGTVLHGTRRRELMDWAGDGGLVIEDDYDAEHRYDRPPVPALHAMLPDRVFYAGSVSKLLAPALRTGWVIAPPRHRDALVDAKRFADLGNAALPQLVLADLMESGEMERQLRTLRRRHRARRDAMIAAIRARLPGAVAHGAAAGLHLLVTFPEHAGLRDGDLAAAALERGVKTQPLSWHAQRPAPPGLVLGYAATAPSVIDDGIAAVAAALRDLT
ncbi:PLP-dependent aminotransferase family protein [Actinomadura verrucosospora]|uniref:Transcriptional regulator, GntR family with aminotransferase domain-containing protein n=1 Tax=Actinomadura verrucosospora TaxID=46165 RepID=A0A7D4AKR3_ACTVE|nr:PLP-dependent aminotransferase family protein [Actinomadura verrucosospora]QKG19049.1 transcriptional regulator, GntR family with aminotransferase domain-containing protein [Actinomadura verrucosospora]